MNSRLIGYVVTLCVQEWIPLEPVYDVERIQEFFLRRREWRLFLTIIRRLFTQLVRIRYHYPLTFTEERERVLSFFTLLSVLLISSEHDRKDLGFSCPALRACCLDTDFNYRLLLEQIPL
jgi:hypothetical protein